MNLKKISRSIFLLTLIFSFNTTYASTNFSLLPDLTQGQTNPAVAQLQKLLNLNGYTVNSTIGGPGSPGYETNYFGQLTKQALASFQKTWSISPTFGNFGAKTKATLQTLVSTGQIKDLSFSPAKPGTLASNGTYVPPIGIPAPSFGINETYRMYDIPANRNPNLTYTQNSEGGYYTHYVDNSNPNAADYYRDSNNNLVENLGTASFPRLTIPQHIYATAGMVMEIHGGPYLLDLPYGGYVNTIDNNLSDPPSSAQPAFIRAASNVEIGATQSVIDAVTGRIEIGKNNLSYTIIENYTFRWILLGITGSNTNHVALRNSELVGQYKTAIDISPLDKGSLHDVVIYKNKIHDTLDWNNTSADYDHHGLDINTSGKTLGTKLYNVWVLDSTIYHVSGDGAQVNGNTAGNDGVNHIYIGGNETYQNRQSGFWVKQASDVIISQNYIYDMNVEGLGLSGSALGFMYGPDRVWFIFNEIRNCSFGVRQSDTDGALFLDHKVYIVGNYIHDLRQITTDSNLDNHNDWGSPSGWGIGLLLGGMNRYVINNTIANVYGGIESVLSGSLYATNNIIYNIKNIVYSSSYFGAYRGAIEVSGNNARANVNFDHNIIYGQSDGTQQNKIVWLGTQYDTVADTQAVNSNFTNNFAIDPLTSSGLLKSTSPAINAGTESDVYQTFQNLYGIDIRKDFNGNPRPQDGAWDIGAFEYQGTYTPPSTYTLTTETGGTGVGTITGNNSTYTSGATATLTAVPATGSTFTSFSGCDSTSNNTCTVTMSSNKTVTATFGLNVIPTNPTYTLTLTTSGTGSGTLTKAVNSVSTTSTSFKGGTVVTITANTNTGSTFSSFSGCDSTSNNTCTVIMSANKTINAVFNTTTSTGGGGGSGGSGGGSGGGTTNPQTYYTLTVKTNGTGKGTITGNTSSYTSGTVATLTATANASSTFTKWSGCTTVSNNICTITITSNKTVTATFNGMDKIISITGPSIVQAGKSYTVRVVYNAPVDRALTLSLGTFLGTTTFATKIANAKAGANKTVSFSLNIPNTVPLNTELNYFAFLSVKGQPLAPIIDSMLQRGVYRLGSNISQAPSLNYSSSSLSFETKNLQVGMTDPQVLTLQEYLNQNGYTINPKAGEPGSLGYETEFFGQLTKQAVIRLQRDHNIPQTGIVGPLTREVVGM